MSTHAQAEFEVQSWDENPYEELDGEAKLTRASVGQGFTGDLEGDGSVEWLMCYREDKTADFVGLQRFVGRLGGRSGSFVMHTQGSFDGTRPRAASPSSSARAPRSWPASRARGAFAAPLGSTASVELDYDLE